MPIFFIAHLVDVKSILRNLCELGKVYQIGCEHEWNSQRIEVDSLLPYVGLHFSILIIYLTAINLYLVNFLLARSNEKAEKGDQSDRYRPKIVIEDSHSQVNVKVYEPQDK